MNAIVKSTCNFNNNVNVFNKYNLAMNSYTFWLKRLRKISSSIIIMLNIFIKSNNLKKLKHLLKINWSIKKKRSQKSFKQNFWPYHHKRIYKNKLLKVLKSKIYTINSNKENLKKFYKNFKDNKLNRELKNRSYKIKKIKNL